MDDCSNVTSGRTIKYYVTTDFFNLLCKNEESESKEWTTEVMSLQDEQSNLASQEVPHPIENVV